MLKDLICGKSWWDVTDVTPPGEMELSRDLWTEDGNLINFVDEVIIFFLLVIIFFFIGDHLF